MYVDSRFFMWSSVKHNGLNSRLNLKTFIFHYSFFKNFISPSLPKLAIA